MNLTARPLQLGDIKECLSLVSDKVFFKKNDLKHLHNFWRYLLKNRIPTTTVLVDSERPPGSRIVFIGLTLFVWDDFMTECNSSLAAPFSLRVLERWRKGRRAFLKGPEISKQNSGAGLNVMEVHQGNPELSEAELMQVYAKMTEDFFRIHSGYRIKEYIANVFDPKDRDVLINLDLLLRRGPVQVPENPTLDYYILGARREELNKPKSLFSIFQLFHAPDPRFGFTSGEKKVLERALMDETDQEISHFLRLSLWAIKKRWQGIYEKVETVDPQLLVSKSDLSSGVVPSPKAERRRYLLDYLRHHLEEIRPALNPRRKNSTVKVP